MADNSTYFAPIAVDEFGSSRPDDFDAVWLDSYAAIHKSAKDKYGLYVDIVLAIDGQDEPYTEKCYLDFLGNQQGDKINLVPSKDGKSIAGGASEEDILALVNGEGTLKEEDEHEYTGPYVVGNAKKLRPGSWSQMVESIKRLFPDPNKPEDINRTSFPPLLDENLRVRFDFPKGYKFHFMRLPQDEKIQRKSKKDKEGGESQEFLVLCVTQCYGQVEGGNGGASGTSSKGGISKPGGSVSKAATGNASTNVAAPPSDSSDFASTLEVSVLNVLSSLSEEGKLPVKRQSINAAVVKGFKGAEMGKAMGFLNDVNWIASQDRPWTVDDKGMISI